MGPDPVASGWLASGHGLPEGGREVEAVLTHQTQQVLDVALQGQRVSQGSEVRGRLKQPQQQGDPAQQAAQGAVETGVRQNSQPGGVQGVAWGGPQIMTIVNRRSQGVDLRSLK